MSSCVRTEECYLLLSDPLGQGKICAFKAIPEQGSCDGRRKYSSSDPEIIAALTHSSLWFASEPELADLLVRALKRMIAGGRRHREQDSWPAVRTWLCGWFSWWTVAHLTLTSLVGTEGVHSNSLLAHVLSRHLFKELAGWALICSPQCSCWPGTHQSGGEDSSPLLPGTAWPLLLPSSDCLIF